MWFKNLFFGVFVLSVMAAMFAGFRGLQGWSNAVTTGHEGTPLDDHARHTVDQVNREFAETWSDAGLEPAPRADDLMIARRLSLGLTGTIPSLEEIREFESIAPEQRIAWWVDHLLNDRRYADFVAERFARAYVGTENGPFLVYRRRRFVRWLSDRLYENTPYDQLVRRLITAQGIWTSSPEVNFVSVTIDQNEDKGPDPIRLAGRTARAFLGMRIDCLQCHDDNLGTIELGSVEAPREGTQRDFHQLAAFFSEPRISLLGIHDQPNAYHYTFLGSEDEEEVEANPPFGIEWLPSGSSRREQLARWITHRENEPFARAIVNRIWALMCGRPLVEPVDDIPLRGDLPPGLETLARDLVAHDYDLQRLIRIIAATDVYQRDSRAPFEVTAEHERHWAVFPLTRLRPEQIAGSLLQASSLKTIDARTHIFFRLVGFGQRQDFVRRYGDTGEDEFEPRGGTVTQRLLMMNGELIQEKIKHEPLFNAPSQIAVLAPTDDQAVELVYLVILTRRPTESERQHFAGRLVEAGSERPAACEDLAWVLLNSSEFAWNH